MAMFAAVPTVPGFAGLFALLEAAAPGKRSKGAAVWRNAADAGRELPHASLEAFPGHVKKSRAVRARCVLQALEGALAAADYGALFAYDDRKASLGELLVRAGMSEEESRLKIAEAEAGLQETSQEQRSAAPVSRVAGSSPATTPSRSCWSRSAVIKHAASGSACKTHTRN